MRPSPIDPQKNDTKWLLSMAIMLLPLLGIGQIATYTPSGGNATDPLAGVANVSGLTVGDMTRVGATPSSSSGNFRASNWPAGATNSSNTFTGTIDTGKYIQFSLTPNAGYTMDVTGFTFGIGRSGTGPRQFSVRTSADGFAADLTGGTAGTGVAFAGGIFTINTDANANFVGNSIAVSGPSFTGLTSSLTVRVYAFNSEGTSGTGGLAGALNVNGAVTSVGGCGISVGSILTTCDANTAGIDTYTLSIAYTGFQPGVVVTNSGASGDPNSGSDPSVGAGTMVFENINETDNYTITFDGACSSLNASTSGPAQTCDPIPDIAINEINADPSTTVGDANGDGDLDSSDDEFVELVNFGATDLDISSWTLSDGFGVRHTFPAATVVPAGCGIVVFGGGTPMGLFGFALVQTASSGQLGLNNGGDDIVLKDASAITVRIYTYGAEGGNDQSITREPDITGAFVEHSIATGSGGSLFSPGTRIDGTSFSGCMAPSCAISFGVESTQCITTTEGPGDTYSVSIPYFGSQAGVTVINNSGSGGSNTGDDPATISNGTIVISGIDEGTAYSIALSSPCDALVASGASPSCEPVPELAFNEILADPGPADGDANGDGTINTSEDEFVEIVNYGATPIDMSGWTLNDGTGLRHTFPASTVVAAGCGVVIFGGGTPIGSFGFMTVQTASTNSLGLNNTGDDLTLRDAASNVIITYSYGSEGGNDQSITRDPDVTGTFVLHTTAAGSSGSSYSPGRHIDASLFSGCSAPACVITFGTPVVNCLSTGLGLVDTYEVRIPYTNSQAGVTVINNSGSGGSNIGDDPATVSDGEILISGIDEGSAYSITLSSPCDLVIASGASPACEPLPMLVINELDPDQPSSDSGEFIEIKNIGNTTASLNGLRLVLVNGSNDSDYGTALLPNVNLAAGDYFVVCYGSNASPYCDFNGGASIQNGNPDGVRLTSPDGLTIMDQMSYGGTMSTTEGTSATSDLGLAGLGLSRITDGTDTGDNGSDFQRACITPGTANMLVDSDNDGTIDCLDVCPGGPEPGTPCDDLNASTGNDVIQGDCSCAGVVLDCNGVPGGPDVPGAPCDDMDPNTVNDVYQPNCTCLGEQLDCLGTPGGSALPGTPCDDFNPATFNDVYGMDCSCAGSTCNNDLNLEFQSDVNPAGVTWEVLNESGTLTVLSGTNPIPAGSIGTQEICLADGCYRLRVTDGAGDGLTGYALREAGANGRRFIDNTDNMITGASQLANGGTFCLPMGDIDLIYSSCDKMDWVSNKYLVCHADPAVSAVWVVGGANNVQNGGTGYAFWIFDPNGTYSFRRFHAHNTSDGFSPATATRAAHLKLNGWNNTALTPHVPANVLMNVRVRPVVMGSLGEWGAACRMMIDPTRAACPLVNLQDDPANTSDYSCGVSRTFGGSNSSANKIVARPPQFQPAPLAGGTGVRYQFRFRIDGENICIVRPAQTSPTLFLNWSAASGPQLEALKTYQVEVRVSKDQGATWCVDAPSPSCALPVTAWGKECSVTISGVVMLEGETSSIATNGNGALTMYPNPNNGEQLFISLTEVAPEVNTVSVDIYDLTGKRITARTIAVQPLGESSGGFLNTVLSLNGDVASGLYMVNITAGDKTYTERLVIQK